MPNKSKQGGFTPQENLISTLPSVVAGIFVLSASCIAVLVYFPPENPLLEIAIILYGIFGTIYLASYYLLFAASINKPRSAWTNSIISGIAIGGMTFLIPKEIDSLLYILVVVASMTTSLISTRGPSYFLVTSASAIHFITHLVRDGISNHQCLIHLSLVITAVVAIETIQQLKKIAREQINRLEIINELSKQIVSTLETKQVFSLLNAAFQNALEADGYYIGIVNEDDLHLELLYDDGEFFENVNIKRKGTLANWVIKNQRELFLPDLRQNVQLEDVEMIIIGKQKTSLSWMGVPMRGSHMDGVMAISSYRPNAFDRSDMELLSTIAQRAALALDNAYQHALVEEQARLDSLTRVYNHGYFIKTLGEQAEICLAQNQPLTLIMLDIDHFKQYNDTFGHLIGDEILVNLCEVIRSHIKNTDSVGRWGGEEFTVALPNTNGPQAMQVAERIRGTMASLKVHNDSQITIPVPTMSIGIAVFPMETDKIIKLIDLADHRLYTAKERGRDQIEPAAAFWDELKKD